MRYKEKTVEQCMHVLIAVHCSDIYESQKESILEYYGIDIFNEAEKELYGSRLFQIAMK